MGEFWRWFLTVKKFFRVPRQTLLSYDTSLFNLFVDDLHGYQPYVYEDVSTYHDIGDFVNSAYITSSWNNHHCWFGMDDVQIGVSYVSGNVEYNPTGILYTRSGSERKLDIPVVVMDQILRNTKDIVNVMEDARNKQADHCQLDSSMLIPNIGCGHHIAGQRVVYHKLKKITDDKEWKKVGSEFICTRVEELLHTLTSTSSSSTSSPPQFDFSTVAILFEYDGQDLSLHKSPLEQMLLTKFTLGVQTIEQQLLTNNHTNVVMDHCGNIQSYETAVVVFVRRFGGCGDYKIYNAISRARTLCMIVDDYIIADHSLLQNVDVVEWKESNGEGIR